jgi:hypothetical protein
MDAARETIVDPEITRREVVGRVVSGEYRNISFIHEIAGSSAEDVTADILAKATLPEIETGRNRSASCSPRSPPRSSQAQCRQGRNS